MIFLFKHDSFQAMVENRWSRKQCNDPSVSHDTAYKVHIRVQDTGYRIDTRDTGYRKVIRDTLNTL